MCRWSPFHGSNKIGGFAPLDQLDGSKEKARAPVPTTSGDGKQMTVIVTDPLPNCSVCDNKANIRFMPCGHNTMCAEHTKRATRCPEKGCKVCTYTGYRLVLNYIVGDVDNTLFNLGAVLCLVWSMRTLYNIVL